MSGGLERSSAGACDVFGWDKSGVVFASECVPPVRHGVKSMPVRDVHDLGLRRLGEKQSASGRIHLGTSSSTTGLGPWGREEHVTGNCTRC